MVWAISIETRVDIGVAMLLTVKSPFGLQVGWIVIVPPEADALLAAFALWMRAAVDGIESMASIRVPSFASA
jgi:hypothetical protein